VVSGRAEVATFTINRQAWQPGLEEPFVVAVVEMAEQEGLRLTTDIVNCAIDDVYIGMPCKWCSITAKMSGYPCSSPS
jgi:uncharacterized OB-fold protein